MSRIIVQASVLYTFLFWNLDYKNYKFNFLKINQTMPSDVIAVIIAYK